MRETFKVFLKDISLWVIETHISQRIQSVNVVTKKKKRHCKHKAAKIRGRCSFWRQHSHTHSIYRLFGFFFLILLLFCIVSLTRVRESGFRLRMNSEWEREWNEMGWDGMGWDVRSKRNNFDLQNGNDCMFKIVVRPLCGLILFFFFCFVSTCIRHNMKDMKLKCVDGRVFGLDAQIL